MRQESGKSMIACGGRLSWMLAVGLLMVVAVAGSVSAELSNVRLEPVVSGLASPVDMVPLPDNSGRFFIVDQVGIVYLLSADGQLSTFLDIRSEVGSLRFNWEEGGLLGIALHPDFSENGSFYLNYTVPGRLLRVTEFRVSPTDSNRADPGYRHVVMETPQNFHYGGSIAFGPDGYLYIAIGDNSPAHDSNGHAQDTATRHGAILRVHVTPGQPGFTAPPDNPFAGQPDGLDEIWAWGLRNPYRFSFDRATGHLFVGNVGQEMWESIFIATHPGNYGWSVKEGAHWFPGNAARVILTEGPTTDARGNPFVPPVVEYGNTRSFGAASGIGISVVGVQMYRGQAFPELQGKLVFGDFQLNSSGQIAVAHPPAGWEDAWREGPAYDGTLWEWERWFSINGLLKGIAVDDEGELYLLVSSRADANGQTGVVYKVVPAE